MNPKTLLFVPTFLLATLAGGVAAQDHAAHAHDAHIGHSGHTARTASADDAAFAKLDTDKDGKLSASELAGHPLQAHLSMVDADKDGKLDKHEFAAGLKML